MCAHRRQLVVSPNARQDLSDVHLYSEQQWGKPQRAKYSDILNEAMRELVRFPSIGRIRTEIASNLRSRRVKEHVIYYEADDHAVTVLRILHGRMNSEDHLEVEREVPDGLSFSDPR